MSKESKRATRKKIVEFVEKHEIKWYLFSVIFTVLAVPAAFIAFPDVATATFVVASLTGIMSSLAALASALVASNDDQSDPDEEVDPDD